MKQYAYKVINQAEVDFSSSPAPSVVRKGSLRKQQNFMGDYLQRLHYIVPDCCHINELFSVGSNIEASAYTSELSDVRSNMKATEDINKLSDT